MCERVPAVRGKQEAGSRNLFQFIYILIGDREAPLPDLLGALHDQVLHEDPPAERPLRHRPPRVPHLQEDVLQQGHTQEAPGQSEVVLFKGPWEIFSDLHI